MDTMIFSNKSVSIIRQTIKERIVAAKGSDSHSGKMQ